jgi:uncharacterized protein (DUF1778 family)
MESTSLRLPRSDLALIDQAAELMGCSRSAFVRDAAVRAARAVLGEPAVVTMSPEAFDAFEAAVSSPAVASPEMVEKLRRARTLAFP